MTMLTWKLASRGDVSGGIDVPREQLVIDHHRAGRELAALIDLLDDESWLTVAANRDALGMVVQRFGPA
jgi:hypothetical protein